MSDVEKLFELPNLTEQIENENKPEIPEGKFPAVILGLEVKENRDKDPASVGLSWLLGVFHRGDLGEGDTTALDASLLPVYTFIGYRDREGNLYYKDNKIGFQTVNVLAALGITTSAFSLKEQIGKMVMVTVKHETSTWGGPARLVASVKSFGKYEQNGVMAPRFQDEGVLDYLLANAAKYKESVARNRAARSADIQSSADDI